MANISSSHVQRHALLSPLRNNFISFPYFLPSFLPSYETCSINVNPLFHAAIKNIHIKSNGIFVFLLLHPLLLTTTLTEGITHTQEHISHTKNNNNFTLAKHQKSEKKFWNRTLQHKSKEKNTYMFSLSCEILWALVWLDKRRTHTALFGNSLLMILLNIYVLHFTWGSCHLSWAILRMRIYIYIYIYRERERFCSIKIKEKRNICPVILVRYSGLLFNWTREEFRHTQPSRLRLLNTLTVSLQRVRPSQRVSCIWY